MKFSPDHANNEAFVTGSLEVQSMSDAILPDDVFGLPSTYLKATVKLPGDKEVGLFNLLQELSDCDEEERIALIGRSGHSRAALNVLLREITLCSDERTVEADIEMVSLRNPEGSGDRIISTVRELVRNGALKEIGRLLLKPPESKLTKKEVRTAIKRHELWIPTGDQEGNGKKANILKDGTIEIGLDQLHYFFSERNFNRQKNMVNMVLHGKHGMRGIQDKRNYLPNEIGAHEFFVGGIRIALGPYIAVIRTECNDNRVIHLAAQILDGIRTTGARAPRQVELFNQSDHDVLTKDLKVRIEILRIGGELSHMWNRIGSERTLVEGVDFRDLVDVNNHPEILMHGLNFIDDHYSPDAERNNHAILFGKKRVGFVPWQETPTNLDYGLADEAEAFIASEHGSYVTGQSIPVKSRQLTNLLGYVGGDQDHRIVMATKHFPSARSIQSLHEKGVGVFVSEHLDRPEQSFTEDSIEINDQKICGSQYIIQKLRIRLLEIEKKEGVVVDYQRAKKEYDQLMLRNEVYFSGTRYEEMRRLAKEGARFYMKMNKTADAFNEGEYIEEHIREFYKGFWVRPEYKERLDKVDTVIAMYGSHKDEIAEPLREDMGRFMDDMNQLFGHNLAITHGKGPGVMLLADQLAEERDIMRIGVGIGAEKVNQAPNLRPPAMVDYYDTSRLPRQDLMAKLSTISLFNIGGAGTLEEVAITLCNQKLYNNPLAPIIFVDPYNLGRDGKHLWAELTAQIETLSAEKKIGEEEAEKTLHLLASFTPDYCHLVHSYQEASAVIKDFHSNTVKYYEDRNIPQHAIALGYEAGMRNSQETDIPLPGWWVNTVSDYIGLENQSISV